MFIIPEEVDSIPRLNEAAGSSDASFKANDAFILVKLHQAALKKCGLCKGQADIPTDGGAVKVVNTGCLSGKAESSFKAKDSQYEIGLVVELSKVFGDRKLLGDNGGNDEPAKQEDSMIGDLKKDAVKVLKNYVAVFAGKDKANTVKDDAVKVCRFGADEDGNEEPDLAKAMKKARGKFFSDGMIMPDVDFDSADAMPSSGGYLLFKVPYSVGLETK